MSYGRWVLVTLRDPFPCSCGKRDCRRYAPYPVVSAGGALTGDGREAMQAAQRLLGGEIRHDP